ncbi:MAG: ATP-binding protein [Melioribacteraceae bacterium]|nr:ATP-binding protein [Melioribacteraceae bacterium]MDD3559038.1 ATP-binding protein [Melioribacteraceae bacterium]
MVFITGPRQVGKTYLSKQIMTQYDKPQYLNYDNFTDRKIIIEQTWIQNSDLLIFDEIHKMKDWKNYLKGVFDTKYKNQSILVTGSARLNTFRQTGNSLAGRYFHHRLNPLSVRELIGSVEPYEAVNLLNEFGGFPEPLLQSLQLSKEEALAESTRWKNQYYTDLIREDIFEFSRITELNVMKTLLEILRTKVGSPLSFNSIAQDLQVSPNTIKKYVNILDSLYIIFQVRPFHKNIARAILKEPKIYFYDSSYVKANEGVVFENTVAVSLLKHTQFLQDSFGKNSYLHYLRTKDNKEIDFVLSENETPQKFIEVKLSDKQITPSLKYFSTRYPDVESIQLVHNLKQEEERDSIKLLNASRWLTELSA